MGGQPFLKEHPPEQRQSLTVPADSSHDVEERFPGVIFRDVEPVGRGTDNLLTFDRKAIVAAERPDIVMVMLTNADDYQTLELFSGRRNPRLKASE